MDITPTSVESLVSQVEDGAMIALPPQYSNCSLVMARALIRRGVRDLHLVGVPQMGLHADLLIGAGCVSVVETAAVTMGEYGLAPRFTAAAKAGTLKVLDGTCPAILTQLQASEKGTPFGVLRGMIGSDLLKYRDDWKVGENPFAENDPIVYLPALKPDFTMMHALKADREGNIWLGVRRELMLMARASAATLVTVEEIVDENLIADPVTAAGTLPAIYVSAIAEVADGAWPYALPGGYREDEAHLREYMTLAQTEEGFQTYLQRFVFDGEPRVAAE